MNIEIKEPDYDAGFFKYRANQAIQTFEAQRSQRNARETMLSVLEGLYRHAYLKGRHDERKEHAKTN